MENEVLFRDTRDVQPLPEIYETDATGVNIYSHVPDAKYVACPEDIWQPEASAEDEDALTVVKTKSKTQIALDKAKLKAVYVLDHNVSLVVVFIMTFWALFAEDLMLSVPLEKTVDEPFALVSLVFLVIFSIEQIARSIAQYQEYTFSFFWIMELVANVSMVTSLGPIIFNSKSCLEGFVDLTTLDGLSAGTRLARVMRLLRVIRVLRVFNSCSKMRNPEGAATKNQQSAIGKALNEKLVRSMILIVIALQLIFPFLSFDEIDDSRRLSFQMLVAGKNFTSTFNNQLEAYKFHGEYSLEGTSGDYVSSYRKLLHVAFDDLPNIGAWSQVYYNGVPSTDYSKCFSNRSDSFQGCPERYSNVLRCTDLEIISFEGGSAYWEEQQFEMYVAQYNITLACLLIVIILVMYTALSSDVTSMVVQPIESMVSLVKKLSENPNYQLEGQSKSKYETEAVRIALAKIVGLMQLGFGGAGHEIISANLANTDKPGLDLMLRGKKKDCAYGFCDIRQFTDTVECLQDQVMLFTNSVGEIVHQSCHDNRGEPNKNIGDAFLIVWRPSSIGDHSKVVDGALTAFRRCVREIASSQTLQLVTNVEAIHKKFGRNKYRTKLGFGLHFGWSVEGPVGSPKKIDCSYLSPEVKISDRLEAATKIYSSNILMSGQFYDLLSDHIKVGIRLIDHVTLKGGVKPFRIYADDRSNLWLKINPRLVEIYGAEAAYEQFSKTFPEGIDAFIKGDWSTAQQKLEGARDFCPKDSPTLLLMKEMKKRSIDPVTPTAPVDWKGYHDSEV